MSQSNPSKARPELPRENIERALDGDRELIAKFYDRYEPDVRAAVGSRIYRWPKLVPQLEDITHDVWCALLRNRGKYLRYHDPARGVPFSRFLRLVAGRLAWKFAKRRLRHPEVVEVPETEEEDDSNFVQKFMMADFFERLAELVKQRLDQRDQKIFYRYYVRGERLKDIAKQLGMKPNAVWKRNERLSEKLQEMAEELLQEHSATMSPELRAVIIAMFFLSPLPDAPEHGTTVLERVVPASEVSHA